MNLYRVMDASHKKGTKSRRYVAKKDHERSKKKRINIIKVDDKVNECPKPKFYFKDEIIKWTKTAVGLFVILITVTLVGAMIFYTIEGSSEYKIITEVSKFYIVTFLCLCWPPVQRIVY